MLGSKILQSIFRGIFGIPKQPSYKRQRNSARYQRAERPPKKKKIIGKDEGEYIDFEEVIEEVEN